MKYEIIEAISEFNLEIYRKDRFLKIVVDGEVFDIKSVDEDAETITYNNKKTFKAGNKKGFTMQAHADADLALVKAMLGAKNKEAQLVKVLDARGKDEKVGKIFGINFNRYAYLYN